MVDFDTLLVARGIGSRTQQAFVKQNVRRRHADARMNNPRINGVMATPPTVTQVTAAPSGLTKIYNVTTTPNVFRATGNVSPPYLQAGAYHRYPAATPGGSVATNIGDGSRNGTMWRVAIMVDAVKFAVLHGGSALKYRYIIDGQYVDASGYTPPSSSSGTACWDVLDFGSARKERLVIVEGETNMSFGGVYVDPTGTVRHPGSAGLALLFHGDSYIAGVGATQGIDGLAAVAADFLGIEDFTASGVASSGYLTRGTTTLSTLRERIAADLTYRQYDLIVVPAGFNDANTSQSASAAQSEVTLYLQALRAAQPTALIVFAGVWPGQTGPSATWTTMEAAIAAGVAAVADPLATYVPISTDPNGAWITGTGKVGAATGAGNSDLYTGADGIHPPTAGHYYLGRRLADAVASAVAGLTAI